LNLANLKICFDKTIKQQDKGNLKIIRKKMTKQRSLKTHLAKLGYKLEIALQLKCRSIIA
jgi:hypothetical protein